MGESIQAIRVMLVDDHPLFRQGLRIALGSQPELLVAGEASTGSEAMRQFLLLDPDMAVLDIHLPDMTGLDLARQMLRLRPNIRLVILTMVRDEEIFHAAMGLGVLGYVLKESAEDEIVDCISVVQRGKPYVSARLAGTLLRRRSRPAEDVGASSVLEQLTTAELRVLRLLARSMTSKEIALELGISPRTIEAHRANIGSKLGLRGSHSLLRFALSHRAKLESPD